MKLNTQVCVTANDGIVITKIVEEFNIVSLSVDSPLGNSLEILVTNSDTAKRLSEKFADLADILEDLESK